MGKLDHKSVLVGVVLTIVALKFVLPKVAPGLVAKLS